MVTIISNPKSQNFHFSLAVRSAVLQICLLLQQSLMVPTQGCLLIQGPTTLQLLFQVQTSDHPLTYAPPLGQANTIFFFNLASYYQSTTSSQIPQN